PTPPYKNNAFTLAEVLITLVIIGVIAAITVPTLIVKYQKEQTVTRLKKTYSSIAQSIPKAIIDYGAVQNWDFPAAADGGSVIFTDKFLIPYLSVMNNCKDETTGKCEYKYKLMNDDTENTLDSDWARFYLSDGTLIAIRTFNYMEGTRNFKGAYVYVDINGLKKPNVMGKDLFNFKYYVTEEYATIKFMGQFKPQCYGTNRENLKTQAGRGCSKPGTGNGECCAALIMFDSWQIKDDYPW
ncbi:type II secretion system protein, partial [bacterium]|nr:type II secretion system protein [bacterium]